MLPSGAASGGRKPSRGGNSSGGRGRVRGGRRGGRGRSNSNNRRSNSASNSSSNRGSVSNGDSRGNKNDATRLPELRDEVSRHLGVSTVIVCRCIVSELLVSSTFGFTVFSFIFLNSIAAGCSWCIVFSSMSASFVHRKS
jgi:hypothetical protein